MNGTINMFSTKKVNIHGMISSKWTTQDKLSQYKKLINLYTRDHKIIEADTAVNKKRLHRELKGLQKQVEHDRRLLDNVIRGDRQLLRNTLAEHKELQLAYQNTQPERVTECVYHSNFIKRKAVDKLLYQNFLKRQKMIKLKQEQALLSDRLKFACYGQLQQEKDAQILSGKVQEAILKNQAALAIKQIYCNIIDIMRKDALHFDAVITTLEHECQDQSKCLLGATRLGQLATEYLDDRKQEYDFLEKAVIRDVEIRKRDLKSLEEKVENATMSIKKLLRKDSDVNVCLKVSDTPAIKDLHTKVAQVESTLKYLKETTLVPSYEAIYPCLEQQLAQKKRLKMMRQKYERDRDVLLNRKNHAELTSSTIKNTMLETNTQYKEDKNQLLISISEITKEIRKNEAIKKYRSNIIANIGTAIRQLLQLSKLIKVGQDKKKTMSLNPTVEYDIVPILQVPETDEMDACKILPILIHRFTFLMSSYQEKLDQSKTDEAYRVYETMMIDRMAEQDDFFLKRISDSSILDGGYTETSHPFTREDIKKQSEEIVAANTVNEDLVPLFDISLTKNYGKKNKHR